MEDLFKNDMGIDNVKLISEDNPNQAKLVEAELEKFSVHQSSEEIKDKNGQIHTVKPCHVIFVVYIGHAGTLPNGDFVAMVPAFRENSEDSYYLRLINLSAWARKLSSIPKNHLIFMNYGCR